MIIEIPFLKIAFCLLLVALIAMAIYEVFFSDSAKSEADRIEKLHDLPEGIAKDDPKSSYLGWERNLKAPIYFPNSVRSRHVHIMGATGSGKTESVLLNLIDQDAKKGHPIIILDAKGDRSFVDFLRGHPQGRSKLIIVDPAIAQNSVRYNPVASGSVEESAMRLFNSMTWSEEFYKIRSRDVLMRVAEIFKERSIKLTLDSLKPVFASAKSLGSFLGTDDDPIKISDSEYSQLSGLVSQINQLCYGSLGEVIGGRASLTEQGHLDIKEAIKEGKIVYFRLPALVDPETTKTVGRLIIAELAQYAAEVQAAGNKAVFTPVFLDEFGSLACPAFIELIAKARSAGLALHFSHQSMGDLLAVSETFASQVTDNSSTKIVLRVYDPDTAENVARTFGTAHVTKETKQAVKGVLGRTNETGAMSVREVKEFRADPDLIKSLPTGCAFVLMNHAMRPEGSAGDVFYIRFPLPPNYSEES